MPAWSPSSDIRADFPHATPRGGQIKACEFILDSFAGGKKFVVLEAPTGIGKSAIAMTVSKSFESSYYLTIQKMLQDQLSNDFGEYGQYERLLIDLKGRNAYECTYKLSPDAHSAKAIAKWKFSGPHNCADGHCRRKGDSSYPWCRAKKICQYLNQVDKAIDSRLCLMNFASFLNQTTHTKRFEPRQFMVLDEGHNIESQLMNFISLSLTDSEFNGLKFPSHCSVEEYAKWLADNKVLDILAGSLNEAREKEDTRRIDDLKATIGKLAHFLEEMASDVPSRWVVEHTKLKNKVNSRVTFKPVFIDKYAHSHLFDWADCVLIMSATILDVNVMSKSLGIDKSQIAAMRLKSTFPVEKRPIYFQPAARITGGKSKMHVWAKPLAQSVNKICKKYEGKRGIIHTHNFYITEMLINDCDPAVTRRLLYQKEFNNKTEMLEYHAKSEDTITIAPAMHEGIDLVDDLSRFQIVCKVPFPNQFDDKQLAARMETDPQFYEWLTALKLVQSVGRSVRSEEDWADTYIIDGSFEWWYRKNIRMIPAWFKEAVV